MSFPNIVHGTEVETFREDVLQTVPVGTKMIIEDGRAYRYCKNNSSNAMIVALVQQAAIPEVTKYGNMAVATMTAGATVITAVRAETSDMDIDELVNGYFWSPENAQLGPCQRIKSNTKISQGAETGTITPYFPLAIDIGASDSISYIRNTWMNVLIANTTPEAQNAGVSVAVISTSQWGWVQVSGPCRIQTSGSILINDPVTATGNAAGEVKPVSNYIDPAVGLFMSWETSDTDGLFFLIIE